MNSYNNPYHIPRTRENYHTGTRRQCFLGDMYDVCLGKKKDTTNFHNKLFTDAYENNWLEALAVYLMIFYRYPGKIIRFPKEKKQETLQNLAKELGISKNTLIAKLKVLEKNGLVEILPGKYSLHSALILASNKDITKKYNCNKFGLYVNLFNVGTYKDLKYFLKNIPVLSNLKAQKERVIQFEHFSKLRQDLDDGVFIEYSDMKALMRYEKKLSGLTKKKKNVKGDLPNLSLSGICKVTNRKSNTTSLRYKKFLIGSKVIATYNRTEALCQVESKEHYEYLKEIKKIPKYALHSVRSEIAYVKKSSLLFVTTDSWSMKTMDWYFKEHLFDYVEQKISNDNCFKDVLRAGYKISRGTIDPLTLKKLKLDHSDQAVAAAHNVADLYDEGYSDYVIFENSRINQIGLKRERVAGHRFDCNMTRLYEWKGLVATGVPSPSCSLNPS